MSNERTYPSHYHPPSARESIGWLLGGSALCALVAGGYFVTYFLSGYPSGFDGGAHFFITKVYAATLWPYIDGWTDQWFQGMPFPRFYPPLFYLIVGGLFNLVPSVWEVATFKAFTLLLTIILPGLLAILGRVSGVSVRNTVVILLSAVLILLGRPDHAPASWGLYNTFEVGLVTQALGAVAFVNLLIALLRVLWSHGSGLWLLLSSLIFFWANYHIVIIGSIFILIILLMEWRAAPLPARAATQRILLGALCASPWYLMAFLHRRESPGINVESSHYQEMIIISLLMLAPAAALLSLSTDRRNISLALASLTTGLLVFLPLELLPLSIPWQPWRLAGISSITAPLLTGLALQAFDYRLTPSSNPLRRLFLPVLLCAGFILTFHRPYHHNGASTPLVRRAIDEILTFQKRVKTRGYIAVGWSATNGHISPLLSAALSSLPGNRGIWTVFRESSLQSIFAVQIRNIVSFADEYFGIPSLFHLDGFRRYSSWYDRILLAQSFGITRLIYLSDDALTMDRLIAENKLPLRATFRNELATVYDLLLEPIIDREFAQPIMVVGPFQNRERTRADRGLPFLAEELIAHQIGFAPVLAATSCEPFEKLERELKRYLSIGCYEGLRCCDYQINDPIDLINDPSHHNDLLVKIRNKTPRSIDGIFALPLREVEIIAPIPSSRPTDTHDHESTPTGGTRSTRQVVSSTN